MTIPLDKELYERVKIEVYKQYKPSTYRSAALVKRYKELGGTYSGKKTNEGLTRWFRETWIDVNPLKKSNSYPVYRPTVKISNKTPLTLSQISEQNLIEQSKLKQKIKGKKNLPPFTPKYF